MAEKKSNVWVVILLVIGGVILLSVVIIGILAVLGISGARRYIAQAKTAEGRNEANQLAIGIVNCSEDDEAHALPASSRPVPVTLSAISGKKYVSLPGDWSDKAYKCAHFEMTTPQYFQYAWVLDSPTSGHVEAKADLDGDGTAEVTMRVPVTCNAGKCEKGALSETGF